MKAELMKQNKNTPVVRVASAALAAFVLFFSLCVPSFAVNNIVQFDELPILSTLNSTNCRAYGLQVFTNYQAGALSPGIYPCYVSSGTIKGYIVFSETAYSSNVHIICASSGSANANIGPLESTIVDHSFYYARANYSMSQSDCNIPYFNTFDDAVSAFESFIVNLSGTPAHIAVTLKPGYVGYFDISNLSNVSLSLGTSLFSGAKYPGFSTSQAIGTVSSLPSGSFSLPISGTSSISWSGSGQKDLIGRYSSFSYSHVYTSAGGSTYLVVVNPLSGSAPVLSALGASGSNRNGNITVLIDQCRGSKIYSLTESLAIGSGSLDTESNGTSVNDGVYDPDTGSWNFTDPSTGLPEDPSSLPIGGGNDPIIGGTGGNTINEWLEDIANSIKSFFSGAIGAVTTLVSSGSDFIHSLSGLYAWLPGPVYSVLVSALILVITIGVIKVFI